MFVYDGAEEEGEERLLASLSGDGAGGTRLTSRGPRMRLLFFSDTNYALGGFRADYSTHDCPGGCLGRGRCLRDEGICRCHRGWTGPDCSLEACPDDCGVQFGRGR